MLSQQKMSVEIIAATAPGERDKAPPVRAGVWLFVATLAASGIAHALLLFAINQVSRMLPEASLPEAVDVVIIEMGPEPLSGMVRSDLHSIDPVMRTPSVPDAGGRQLAAAVPPVTPLTPVRPADMSPAASPTAIRPPAVSPVAPEFSPASPERPPPGRLQPIAPGSTARIQPVAPASTLATASDISMAEPAHDAVAAPEPVGPPGPKAIVPLAPETEPASPELPPPDRSRPVAPPPALPATSVVTQAAAVAAAPEPLGAVHTQIDAPVAIDIEPASSELPLPARSPPVAPVLAAPAASPIAMAHSVDDSPSGDAVLSPPPLMPLRAENMDPVGPPPPADSRGDPARVPHTPLQPGDRIAAAGAPTDAAPVPHVHLARPSPSAEQAKPPRLAPVSASPIAVSTPSRPEGQSSQPERTGSDVAEGPVSFAKQVAAPAAFAAPLVSSYDAAAVSPVHPGDPATLVATPPTAGMAVAALPQVGFSGQVTRAIDLASLLDEQIAGLSCASITVAFDDRAEEYVLAGFTSSETDFAHAVRSIADVSDTAIINTSAVRVMPEPFCSALIVVHRSGAQLSEMQKDISTTAVGTHRFREGEIFSMGMLTPEFDGFIYVDYFAHTGEVAHLVSDTSEPESNFFRRNEWLKIGGLDGVGRRGVITPPFGLDWVLGLASTHPLGLEGRPPVEPVDDYLSALSNALLDLKQRYPHAAAEYVHLFVRTEPATMFQERAGGLGDR